MTFNLNKPLKQRDDWPENIRSSFNLLLLGFDYETETCMQGVIRYLLVQKGEKINANL